MNVTNLFGLIRTFELDSWVDSRGALVVAELAQFAPFDCRRLFIIHSVPSDATRGAHAHRECHQLLIAASGSVEVHIDDGLHQKVVVLDHPRIGLYLPPLTWAVEREFSADCALLVLASHPYDPADYIHDYDDFLATGSLPR